MLCRNNPRGIQSMALKEHVMLFKRINSKFYNSHNNKIFYINPMSKKNSYIEVFIKYISVFIMDSL